MDHESTFRMVLVGGAVALMPITLYYRLRSQATHEKLDRRQEGLFVLLTLRPVGVAGMLGLLAYMISPSSMAWSSVPLPAWMRWIGVGIGVATGGLLWWTLASLGRNLTDTVVTRKEHTLVTTGPYHWVRHPFYDSVALFVLSGALAAANWFLLLSGGVVLLLLLIRTSKEEDKLRARFGEAYIAYSERTGRFVPRVGVP